MFDGQGDTKLTYGIKIVGMGLRTTKADKVCFLNNYISIIYFLNYFNVKLKQDINAFVVLLLDAFVNGGWFDGMLI